MTFEEWLKDVQGVDAQTLKAEEQAFWRQSYAAAMARAQRWREQQAPSRQQLQRDRRYAIAIDDGTGLGLTFWIKRSSRGEIFLLYPREAEMDPHASYHLDGTFHYKSYGRIMSSERRQPLNANFKGAEHLGKFGGHGPGPRIQELDHFDDVIVPPPNSLGGRFGSILVDLVSPGEPAVQRHREGIRIVAERVYEDAIPWIIVAIASSPASPLLAQQ